MVYEFNNTIKLKQYYVSEGSNWPVYANILNHSQKTSEKGFSFIFILIHLTA